MKPQHVAPISFQYSPAHPNTKSKVISRVHGTTQQPGLDWKTWGDWRDNYERDKQWTDTQHSQVNNIVYQHISQFLMPDTQDWHSTYTGRFPWPWDTRPGITTGQVCLQYRSWQWTKTGISEDIIAKKDQWRQERDRDTFKDNRHWQRNNTEKTWTDLLIWQSISHHYYLLLLWAFLYTTSWDLYHIKVCLPSTVLYKNRHVNKLEQFVLTFCYCERNASLKKCVFSRDLKVLMSLAFQMCSGRSFQ